MSRKAGGHTRSIYTGSSGQANRTESERLPFDGETGLTALQASENVYIDSSAMVRALGGTVRELDGHWHSLTVGQERGREVGYAIKERPDLGYAIIVRLDTDQGSIIPTVIGQNLTLNRRMSWAWAGHMGGWRVFFTNGTNCGMISGSSVTDWPRTENNPDPDTTDDYRQLADFFQTTRPLHLGWSGFRMFFSFIDDRSHCLGVTMHGSYGLWRRRDWLQWPDRIIMYAPARDGHYIGTETKIYFIPSLKIASDSLAEFVVADYPPIEHGMTSRPVNPAHFGFESNAPSYITATATGPVMLLPGGNLINLIDGSLRVPNFDLAGAAVFYDSLLIQSYGE